MQEKVLSTNPAFNQFILNCYVLLKIYIYVIKYYMRDKGYVVQMNVTDNLHITHDDCTRAHNNNCILPMIIAQMREMITQKPII